jgi:hypothetical protein
MPGRRLTIVLMKYVGPINSKHKYRGIYLLNHVSAESLTIGRMIPSGSNSATAAELFSVNAMIMP